MTAAHTDGNEYEPGHYLALIHLSHTGELEALGWRVLDLYPDDDVPDVVCPHMSVDRACR